MEAPPRWQTDSGKILDPQQIYHHGDFNVRFDGHTIYVDEELPDGADTHAVLDTETGAIRMEKFPYGATWVSDVDNNVWKPGVYG